MINYYNEEGDFLGQAQGYSYCERARKRIEHLPHSHDPEYAFYGPYMCGGYPVVKLYTTPYRKPVN